MVLAALNILEHFLNPSVILTSLESVVAFSRRFHFFVTTLHKSMAPQILNFSARPQWRCPTSVAPDAKSCLFLRLFWLLWLLWDCSECLKYKNLVLVHLPKPGRFCRSLRKIGNLSQGAGELGPLGSAGRKMWWPETQKYRNHCYEIDG